MEDYALTPELITLGHDLLAFKRYYVGMAALLAYDYCLMFNRELENIWKGRRTAIFYLYLVNRYLPMAFCVITLTAYFSPLWTIEVYVTSPCNRFAIVKWLETLLIVVPAETVLVLRSYALTSRSRAVVAFLVSMMIVQCCVVFYAMSRPGQNHALQTPAHLADPYHICILFSEPKMDTAYLGVSILFDFTVFLITMRRTLNFGRKKLPRTHLLQTVLRDGVLYFAAILAGNIAWMICALTGRKGIKLINAQPSMILTSIMISRLTISLRTAAQSGEEVIEYSFSRPFSTFQARTGPNIDIELSRASPTPSSISPTHSQ